jgi:transcription antitermination factor NusG
VFTHAEPWVVVWIEPRAEKKVEARLRAQGIEAWLPTFTDRRRWSDRWKDVVLPLFPGYLFARASEGAQTAILRTSGVLTLVKTGSRPSLLTNEFVTSLRRAIEDFGMAASPTAEAVEFHVGDEVIVRDGPLAGARGYVREVRGYRSLVIWIQEIGRGVAFRIGSAGLKLACASASPRVST